jgi:HD-like signal output (HDOD) protein
VLEAERGALDVDHAEIGLWVAESWNFPATLKEPIAYHHDPARSEDRSLKTAIVHLADILAHSLGFGHYGNNVVPELNQKAWDVLQLSVKDLREIVEEVDNELSVTDTALYRST